MLISHWAMAKYLWFYSNEQLLNPKRFLITKQKRETQREPDENLPRAQTEISSQMRRREHMCSVEVQLTPLGRGMPSLGAVIEKASSPVATLLTSVGWGHAKKTPFPVNLKTT